MTTAVNMPDVFVLLAFYSDKSGCKLLGVYTNLGEAEERKQLMEASGSSMSIAMVKMPVNRANPQEVW